MVAILLGTSALGTKQKTHPWETIMNGLFEKVYENRVHIVALDYYLQFHYFF